MDTIRKPDISVLTETWFNETNIDSLSGHKSFESVRTEKWVVDFSFRNHLSSKALLSYSNTELIENGHV